MDDTLSALTRYHKNREKQHWNWKKNRTNRSELTRREEIAENFLPRQKKMKACTTVASGEGRGVICSPCGTLDLTLRKEGSSRSRATATDGKETH